jgi:hypothetical protein
MRHVTRFLLVAFAMLAAVPALAGPPWLSIEFPANPHDTKTREAFLVVNTYHHSTPTPLHVRGTAEGIVAGERRSVTLRFGETERRGSFALTKQWPNEGQWVLNIALVQNNRPEASALVVLGADGTPAHVSIPTRRDGPWHIPRMHTAAEVSAALADAAVQARGK